MQIAQSDELRSPQFVVSFGSRLQEFFCCTLLISSVSVSGFWKE